MLFFQSFLLVCAVQVMMMSFNGISLWVSWSQFPFCSGTPRDKDDEQVFQTAIQGVYLCEGQTAVS